MSLLPVTHQPLRPPRTGHDGECFFARQWNLLMEAEYDDITPLGSILYPLTSEPTQRQAALAASFITWLGTNCGAGFLALGDRLAHNMGLQDGYLAAWALQNHRRSAVNSGVRTIEHLAQLADGSRLPDLSLNDAEVIEHLVAWLARREGQDFLADCRAERRTEVRVAPPAPPAPPPPPGPYDW